MTVDKQDIVFEATDGYPLSAIHFQAKIPRGIIIVASATGVPQSFYRRFAEHAVLQGFDVVTFDYRGIGKSAPSSLKGFDMDYLDWARKDLQALIERMRQKTLPMFLVGHSYGGHALGLINNHEHIKAAYFLGVGAGWHGWMPATEQVRVKLMWNVIGPVLTRCQGYLGWSVLGMGEDLPLGVYKQWKHWCRFANYFFDDKLYPEMKSTFAAVKTPIKAINATDDRWASPKSRDAFLKHYEGSLLEIEDIEPNTFQLKNIGHLGYFRAQSRILWPDILNFFQKYC